MPIGAGFAARRAASAAADKLRGIGVANYVEAPVGAPRERLVLRVLDDGTVEIATGTQSTGQGHETTFAQVAADLLDVPLESVKLVQGESRAIALGGGTHSNRSMRIVGTLLVEACARDRASAAATTGARRSVRRKRESFTGRIPAHPPPVARCANSKSIRPPGP